MLIELTEEEAKVCMEYLEKYRKEKSFEKRVENWERAIQTQVNLIIDDVGLPVAKRIVRQIARDLKDIEDRDIKEP